MYGTIARVKPKPGQEKAILAIMDEWNKTRGSKVKGAVASYILKSEKNPSDLILVAVFQDKKTYQANADDPEQDRWYRRLRELLQSDPAWEDGESIAGQTFKQ